MSVESAWDAELASAGEVLESEHQAYIQQAHVLAQRVVRLEAENAALERIAGVLLRQVKRGGPSNFEQVARHYLDPADLPVFLDRWHA